MATQMATDNITRSQKIAALVTAPGTVVKPAGFAGYVVVIDGRTGRDVCEPTADACFDALLDDESEVPQ